MPHDDQMPLAPALSVLADLRRDEIVVTTMGTTREWPKLSRHPLDFHYLPSAMGHAPAIALGLALAQPAREVWAFDGDGSLLMSLGKLVTIAASGARNYTLIVFDNGVFEVTGGQKTAARGTTVDFAGFARSAGFPSVFATGDLAEWRRRAPSMLAAAGPRAIVLAVEPVRQDFRAPIPGPMLPRIDAFRRALGQPAPDGPDKGP
jgi:phosphonopyruvate decarboxylase